MRNVIFAGLFCAIFLSWPEPIWAAQAEEPNTIGFQADVGVPDGSAFSLAYRPDPFTFTAGPTYNLMAVGARLGVQWDVVSPLTLNVDLGTSGENNLSLFTDKEGPSFYYNYASAHVGFATEGNFRFFMRGGISYVWLSVDDYQNTSGEATVTLRDISGSVLVAPTLKLGINWFVL